MKDMFYLPNPWWDTGESSANGTGTRIPARRAGEERFGSRGEPPRGRSAGRRRVELSTNAHAGENVASRIQREGVVALWSATLSEPCLDSLFSFHSKFGEPPNIGEISENEL